MEFTTREIDEYAREHCEREPKLLIELSRETWANVMIPRMLSGHLQGRVLSMFSKIIKPENIIEIGTYTGYSAICLAEGLQKNGQLHTIEINEELEDFASKYFKKAKLDKKITLHIGDALNIIPTLDLLFDIVFIDADKKNYCQYYELALQKINKRGYILIDNVLWSGKVLSKAKKNDYETLEIQKLNQKITNDKRVENVLLPLRDGLMICKVL